MSNTQREILLGLVGHPSSGKDTVAAYLVEKYSFVHISTSDMIRFYIAEHGLGEATRELMASTATMLREEHGNDHNVRMALENDAPRLAVSALRTVGEAQAIKDAGGTLICCTAPIEDRYKRAVERGSSKDKIGFEEFKRQEEAESVSNNPEAQNVASVIALADMIINNDGTIEDLERKVDEIVSALLPESKSSV